MTRALITFAILFIAAITTYFGLALVEPLQGSYWFLSFVFVLLGWALAWAIGWVFDAVLMIMKAPLRITNFLVPALFGVTIIVAWEYYVKGSHIPLVLLPAPTQIGTKFLSSLPILGADSLVHFCATASISCAVGSCRLAIWSQHFPLLALHQSL
jgi:NitT/TauT family transport system permease protein